MLDLFRTTKLAVSKYARAQFRRIFYSPNTIRYVVEWRCLEAAVKADGRTFDRIMDGGCGSGEMLRKMLDGGFAKSGVGIELDPQLFTLLKENIGDRSNVEVINAGLEKIPLTDNYVDAIMTTQVLEHIVDHESVAAEFYRVLQPGGLLLAGVPHPPEPFPNAAHVREGYTEADLRALFEPLGFVACSFDYYLIDSTIEKILAADKLPLRGSFLPISWADKEKHLSTEERRKRTPFGILGVFTKP